MSTLTQRVRRIVKRAAERSLMWSGAARYTRRRRGRNVLILGYHNIVPRGEPVTGDVSLHLPQEAFGDQLDCLTEAFTVVALTDALTACGEEVLADTKPRVAITFDDAYRGAATAGVHELRARGLPATLFVAPAFVGDRSFWWDAILPNIIERERDVFRRRALEEWNGQDERIRREAAGLGIASSEPPPHARCITEAELADALTCPEMAIASHTWTHPNLTRLHGPTLDAELARPLAWLRERCSGALPVLSYPYGRYNPDVAARAADVGYVAALCIDGGWVDPTCPRPHALPRLNVPAGLSRDGFVLRASGAWR